MTFGETVRQIRKQKGMTQQELGEKLNMSQAAIGQFERSKKTPKFETLNKFADALDVDANDLFNRISLNTRESLADESIFYNDNIMPILEKLGCHELNFIRDDKYGNKVSFIKNDKEIILAYDELKDIYDKTESTLLNTRISDIRASIYGRFLEKEIEKEGV